jgi:hypothetical protein
LNTYDLEIFQNLINKTPVVWSYEGSYLKFLPIDHAGRGTIDTGAYKGAMQCNGRLRARIVIKVNCGRMEPTEEVTTTTIL